MRAFSLVSVVFHHEVGSNGIKFGRQRDKNVSEKPIVPILNVEYYFIIKMEPIGSSKNFVPSVMRYDKLRSASACFFLGFLSSSEHGGDMFFRNIGLSPN
jgi:hypothetical protein